MKIKYPLFRKFEIWYVDTIAFFKVARKKDWVNKLIREWSYFNKFRVIITILLVLSMIGLWVAFHLQISDVGVIK